MRRAFLYVLLLCGAVSTLPSQVRVPESLWGPPKLPQCDWDLMSA